MEYESSLVTRFNNIFYKEEARRIKLEAQMDYFTSKYMRYYSNFVPVTSQRYSQVDSVISYVRFKELKNVNPDPNVVIYCIQNEIVKELRRKSVIQWRFVKNKTK